MGFLEYLEEQQKKDLELLKELENKLRFEDNPRNKLKWEAELREIKQNIQNRQQEISIILNGTIPINPNEPQKKSSNQRAKNKLVISIMCVITVVVITGKLFNVIKVQIPVTPENNPSLKITQPSQKSKVQRFTQFTGTSENLPETSIINLYIYASGTNTYYCYPARRNSDGSWDVNVYIGTEGYSDIEPI
jgi:hypothetical protein